ncbi:hypothetical protein DN730_05135 [Marinomonas piezotolerans]|uniref:Uncharacterized protein n=1 Tax=Marinomonas piezotolerans TaxID=2213058 RepID=A0A370UB30_9GAMM|nr:hypothetical protein [Marinomonas piezotolerans]RDL45003.1 hypothetical protein DN730_05135 [Marinomonas piezotolerans]
MPQELYVVSLIFSCLALVVSGITAWLTLFHKGSLKATQPTTIFFGPDGPNYEIPSNKVYLRTLLYSTAKKGQVLESLYVSLKRNESNQNFSIWVYGDKNDLKRGSGLFIPQDGVTFDHHFLMPSDGAEFKFISGDYQLKLYARLVGEREVQLLYEVNLYISEQQAKELSTPNTGIHFDWGADQRKYHAHIRSNPAQQTELIAELLANKLMQPTAKASAD